MICDRKFSHRILSVFTVAALLIGIISQGTAAETPTSGKRIVESYDAISVGTTIVQSPPIESTEGYAVKVSAYNANFPNFAGTDQWDWRGANYYMVYLKNDANTKLVAFDLTDFTNLANQTSAYSDSFHLQSGKNVYLDNGATVTAVAAAENRYVSIPANFEGYVKIPFSSLYRASGGGSANGVLDYQYICKLGIRGKNAANFSGALIVDTLSVSYDSDITTVFNKQYLTVEENLDDGLENIFKVIKDFYLDNNEISMTSHLGGKGQVAFDNAAMEITYHDTTGTGNTIWTSPITDLNYRDWSGNKYFVLEVKNNTPADTKMGFYFSMPGNDAANPTVNPAHWQIKQGTTVYYRTAGDSPTITSAKTDDPNFVKIGGGFDGYVIIPFSHLTLEKASTSGDSAFVTTIYGVQFLFAGGTQNLSLRVERIGLGKSDLLRDMASEITIIDESEPVGTDVDDGLANRAVVLKNWYNMQSGNVMGKDMGNNGDVVKQNGYFHFTYTGNAVSVWNGDNPLSVEDRDWSSGKYMVVDVNNLSASATRMGFYFSESGTDLSQPNTNPEHWGIKQGAIYYLRSRDGSSVVKAVTSDALYIEIPGGFDGYILVPFNTRTLEVAAFCNSDRIFDPAHMYTVSFSIPDATAGMNLKISNIAYAKSHNIRDGGVPIIWIDESDPFIPVPEDPADDGLDNDVVWFSGYISDQNVVNWAQNIGAGGKVYKKKEQMRVTFTDPEPGDARNTGASIWTASFSNPANMDWSDGKYLVIDITNNTGKDFNLGFYLSESGPNPLDPSQKPEQWTLEGGTKVIYRTRQVDGVAATVSTIKSDKTYFTVPANFDGYICVRLIETNLYSQPWADVTKDDIFNRSSIYGVSWQLPDGTAGADFTLNGAGLGKSVNIQYGEKPLAFSVMKDGFIIPPEELQQEENPKFSVFGGPLYDSELGLAVFRNDSGYAQLNTLLNNKTRYRYLNVDLSLTAAGTVSVFAKSAVDGCEIKLSDFSLSAGDRSVFAQIAGGIELEEFYLVTRFTNGANGKLYNIGLSNQKGVIPGAVSPLTGESMASLILALILFCGCAVFVLKGKENRLRSFLSQK